MDFLFDHFYSILIMVLITVVVLCIYLPLWGIKLLSPLLASMLAFIITIVIGVNIIGVIMGALNVMDNKTCYSPNRISRASNQEVYCKSIKWLFNEKGN